MLCSVVPLSLPVLPVHKKTNMNNNCYYLLENQVNDETNNIEKISVKYTIYLDQILDGPNKQDRYCVLGLLECALLQITNDI